MRAALGRARGALGTRASTAALLALVVLYQLAAAAWDGWGAAEEAEALRASWAFWLLAGAVAADAAARIAPDLARAFPEAFRAGPPPGLRARVRSVGRASLSLGWLLAGLGMLASLAARDRFTLWAAEGETFEGLPGQYLTRAPPRPLSPGPGRLVFTVESVEGEPEGRPGDLRVAVVLEGERAVTGHWRPLWLGGARFLRATASGYAPHLVVVEKDGDVVEDLVVKLALFPAGSLDHVRLGAVPHRVYVGLAGGADGGRGPREVELLVGVFRGKLPVAEGRLAPGGELAFEGLTLRMPEVLRFAELELVEDPGLPILAAAALLALAGAALASAGRRAG